MRNDSDKSYREDQNTHFVFSNLFSENSDVYEKNAEKFVEPGSPQMKI